jgi:hypothetical protein
MHFHRPGTHAATEAANSPPLTLDTATNTTAQPTKTLRMLGITLDNRLLFREHLAGINTHARQSLGILTSLGKSTWGASLTDRRNIYQATILPILLYGASAWYAGNQKGFENSLTPIHYTAERYIAGAYRGTSGDALGTELFLTPMPLKLRQT